MGRRPIPLGGHGDIRPTQVKDRLWVSKVRWRDDAGGYHRVAVDAPTKGDCRELAAERVREALEDWRTRQVDAAEVRDLTLDEAAELWFTALARTSRRPSTIEQYRACWRGTLSPVLGHETVTSLDRARVQHVLLEGLFARHQGHRSDNGAWVAGEYRLDENGDRIPLHGAQPRNVMRLLLRWTADRGLRDGNPLDGTASPQRRQPKVRALTDEEATRLTQMAEGWFRTGHGASDTLWHGLILLRHLGLRLGELLALTWSDVDLETEPPTVTVRHTLLEQRGAVTGLGPTKGGTIDIIALHERVVAVLETRMPTSPAPDDFVFATRTGRPVTHANFRRALRDLVRDTDLAWVHPHSMRHTLGTKANEHLDLEAARDLLRHKDDAVTRKHYVERNSIRILDPRGLFESEK
ncbi:hypothetical protein ASC77_18610 [Nocardioides sp. Root1257]|uniref:tyrosine-type recombinase/integrase n=1 Tax=unclassified Nocardioides TaxID=2615069 RepID=UPI0006F6192F|nr:MULTISPECIES: tyrosine-type recombinase/integrase [unclassified Nocardioides]KQW45929.1 hypothetical protein ASC77_18610 [Nocardioides sp. Root1257]KRC43193.1 hypothetical protein ASE24_19575 [Nocardioides sp. Root224]